MNDSSLQLSDIIAGITRSMTHPYPPYDSSLSQLSDVIAGIAAAASTSMDADLHARKVAALPPKLFAEDAVASLGGEARLRPTVGAAAATTVMVGQPCMSTLPSLPIRVVL